MEEKPMWIVVVINATNVKAAKSVWQTLIVKVPCVSNEIALW
jgi:hypothetical protein